MNNDVLAGSVDRCLPLLVSGWAWNPKDPESRVTVQAVDPDGKVFMQFRVSRFRQDLLDAGIGDGYHGFEFCPFGNGAAVSRKGVKFRILETGVTLPFSDVSQEYPRRLSYPAYSLSEQFAPSESDLAEEKGVNSDIKALSHAVDSLYKTIETKFPSAALALNNAPNRLLPFIPLKLDVLFLVGLSDGESKRYRVYNIVEALEAAGYTCGVYIEPDIELIIQKRPLFSTCVVFRAPLTPVYQTMIDYARSISARVVWDIDDYAFDLAMIPQIDGLRYLTHDQKVKNAEGMRLYRKFLTFADLATTTTKYLADRMAEAGQTVAVIPNTLNNEQIEFAARHANASVRNSDVITISFFSGTKTHDRDFLDAKEALVTVMNSYQNVRFVVVGHFDIELHREFDKFGSRVEKIPFVPYMKMLDLLRYIDIIIVPLELIAYCHGKSELKFFEAALVGCVTVASATEAYRAAIENGVTGYVCDTFEDWVTSLNLLCGSSALRQSIADAAKEVALTRYVMASHLSTIVKAYGLPSTCLESDSEPTPRALENWPTFVRSKTEEKRAKSSARGAFILPDLLIGGGGHRKAIMFASALEQAQIDVDLVFQNSTRQTEELGDIINGSYSPFSGKIRLFSGSFSDYDWVVATSWSTAVSILERGYPPSQVIYLVQDFEPLFYSMGSEYIRAEATYLAGFKIIAFGDWIAAYLKQHYNVNSSTVPFSIDRDVYKPWSGHRGNRLLFFAKPEMARRCFEISADALRIFKRLRPAIEICTFGSNQTRNMQLGFEFTDLGVVTNLAELSSLYRNAALGIAISTTNPSILGYEMLACGCPVVDIDRPDMNQNYRGGGLGLIPVRPFARDYAEQLVRIFDDPIALRSHQTAAPDLVEWMPTDAEVCAMFVEEVLEFIAKKARKSVT